MSVFIIPQNQIIYNDPYTQRLFEYQAPGAQCEYVLARAVNNLLKLYGDKVFKGLRITSASIDDDNNLVITVEKGVAVADSTLIFINEDVTLTFPNINSYDVGSGNFAVFLNYQYLFSLKENPVKIVVYYVDSETTYTDSPFDINRDRLLLCYLSINPDDFSITIHCNPDDYLIVYNTKYYVGGSFNGDEFEPFESYLDRAASSKRIFHSVYDNVLQMIIDYVENNVLDVLKRQDGHGSGLDADTVDGKHASDLANVDLSNVEGSDIVGRITQTDADGHGSGFDADMVDGKHASDLANVDLSNVEGSDIVGRITQTDADGPGSGLDADTVDGKHALDFANVDLSNVKGSDIISRVTGTDPDTDADGPGSGLDADTVDGKHALDFANVDLSNVEGSDIVGRITQTDADGHGSGFDADMVDGKHASEFADKSLSNVNDSIILEKLRHVDGQNSELDADKLDGRHASEFAYHNLSNVSSSKILEKLLEVNDKNSGIIATTLQGYEPSKTPKRFAIPVTNQYGKIPREFLDLGSYGNNNPPVIDSIRWDSNNLQSGQQYHVTINATDPDNDPLRYAVTCQDGDVSIFPSGWSDDNTFIVTFPDYSEDTTVTFTYRVSDGTDTTTQTEQKTVRGSTGSNNPPVIDSISWDNDNLQSGQQYHVTINATDPDGDPLRYAVTCQGGSNVSISPSSWSSNNTFTITFPDYSEDTTITFTYRVTDGTDTTTQTEQKTVRGSTGSNNPPVINSIEWNKSVLYERHSYTVTIHATDPDRDPLQYAVTCQDGNVSISPSGWSDDNTFTVTFPDYGEVDRDVTFTYKVRDRQDMVTTDEIKKIYTIPIIKDVSWNPYPLYAGQSYTVSIRASHPDGSNILRYKITANVRSSYVNIIPSDWSSSNTFTVSFDNFNNDTDVLFVYSVKDNQGNLKSEEETITVHANGSSSGLYGVFAGGQNESGILSNMEYITVISSGSVVVHGGHSLTQARLGLAATSDGSNDLGVFGAGATSDGNSVTTMDYVTISTRSNADSFQSLSYPRYGLAAASNRTGEVGAFAGGYNLNNGSYLDVIEYIDMLNKTVASEYGSLGYSPFALAATSNAEGSKGVFAGGYESDCVSLNTMKYVDIYTTSNAQPFGTLGVARSGLAATSNGTDSIGVFVGGFQTDLDHPLTTIEMVNIVSATGGATSHGNLSVARIGLTATSNGTGDVGVFGGGYNNGFLSSLEWIAISTGGTAKTDGWLITARFGLAATSNA